MIAEHLAAAGFVEYEVDSVAFTNRFASFEEWWTVQSEMSSRLREALSGADPTIVEETKAAVSAAAEPYTEPDGSIPLPARTWTAVAAA